MVDVNITDSGRRDGKQPTHAPYGGKNADTLSNSDAAKVFPPTHDVQARPKPNPQKPDARWK